MNNDYADLQDQLVSIKHEYNVLMQEYADITDVRHRSALLIIIGGCTSRYFQVVKQVQNLCRLSA